MQQGMAMNAETDCGIYEALMEQKLILHQARLDSVKVTGSQVQQELDRRIRYFVQQVGSEEKLEEFYGMSIEQIKSNFYDMIQDQMLTQRMRQHITTDVSVTPSDVREYYRNLHEDSIPLVPSKVRVAHIVKRPPMSQEARDKAKEELEEYREAIVKGEKRFSVVATLYSDDPGSAKEGGSLGMIGRGEMVPEFESTIFSLDEGEVSEVFETQFGYHIAQLEERLGEKLKVRHILIKPEVSSESLMGAKDQLDSIRKAIKNDTLDFAEAARLYSDDDDTRNNGGVMANPRSGSSWFEMEEVNPELFFTIDKMNEGEISKPVVMNDQDKGKSYRLIKLLERTRPHKANLQDDYDLLKKKARQAKEDQALDRWFREKISETYVRIGEKFRNCNLQQDWMKEQ